MPELFRCQLLHQQVVECFWGAEMALREAGPIWSDPTLPLLQCTDLYFGLLDRRVIRLRSFFNERAGAELLLEESAKPKLEQGFPGSVYRTRELTELPRGRLLSLTIGRAPDGSAESWRFQLGSTEVLVLAGEVEEQHQGYRLSIPDESLLIFSPPERINQLKL